VASHFPLTNGPEASDPRFAATSHVVGRGERDGVERQLRTALSAGDRQLSRDHDELARLLHDLALFYVRDGRFDEAEPLLLRLYYMKCRTSGKEHPEAAAVLATLASLRQAQGHHHDAEGMWRQVLAIREQQLGPADPATVAALEHLAESCNARGKHREAGHLLAQATLLREHSVAATPPRPVGLVLSPPPAYAMPTPPGHAPSAEPGAPTPSHPVEWTDAHSSIAAHPSTQAALRAIQAELLASELGEHGTRFSSAPWLSAVTSAGGRRLTALLTIAAAAVLTIGLMATGSRAASTLGARADAPAPVWEVWTPPAPLNPPRDSVRASDTAEPIPATATRAAPRARTSPRGVPARAVTTSNAYEVRLAGGPSARRAGAPPVPAVPVFVHARLVGPVPRPAYPDILSDRRLEGDVVVRFVVDEDGIPDTASVIVLRTPHDVLTDAVRRVIPTLRFEPARRATRGAPAERDEVQMTFPFVWRAP
jgi:TonB family protein